MRFSIYTHMHSGVPQARIWADVFSDDHAVCIVLTLFHAVRKVPHKKRLLRCLGAEASSSANSASMYYVFLKTKTMNKIVQSVKTLTCMSFQIRD